MREQVWAIFGAIPKSNKIVILGLVRESREQAEIIRDEMKEKTFQEEVNQAVYLLLDLCSPNTSMARARLRLYLTQIGVGEEDLDETMTNLLLSLKS